MENLKLCGDGCYPVCDFCKKFRGIIKEADGEQYYSGNGICEKDGSSRDALEGCDDFICQNTK